MQYEGKRRASPLNMRSKRGFEEVPDTQCMEERSEKEAIVTTFKCLKKRTFDGYGSRSHSLNNSLATANVTPLRLILLNEISCT